MNNYLLQKRKLTWFIKLIFHMIPWSRGGIFLTLNQKSMRIWSKNYGFLKPFFRRYFLLWNWKYFLKSFIHYIDLRIMFVSFKLKLPA